MKEVMISGLFSSCLQLYSIDNRKTLRYINSTDMAWGSPILMCVFCKNKLGCPIETVYDVIDSLQKETV